MDISQFAILAAVIAGATELIGRLRARDFWVVATITTAAVIGGLFGAVHYYAGLDIPHGIALGFGASGALTALGKVGGSNSVAAPSDVLRKS